MQQRYKAEFITLVSTTEGLVKISDVDERELRAVMKKHNGKVNGSKGNYAVYDKARSRLYMNLYIRENFKTVKIDIRDKVMSFSGFQKISKQFRIKLSNCLPKVVEIEYDSNINKWKLSDSKVLMKAVEKALKMK